MLYMANSNKIYFDENVYFILMSSLKSIKVYIFEEEHYSKKGNGMIKEIKAE